MGITFEEVANLSNLSMDTVSTNSLVNADETTELEAFIPDDNKNTEEIIISKTLKKYINKLLIDCGLSEREIGIISARYGLNNKEPMNLVELGKYYGLTTERVRQIEANAFKKIRRSKYVKEFAVYMENPSKALEMIEEYKKHYLDDGRIFKKYI